MNREEFTKQLNTASDVLKGSDVAVSIDRALHAKSDDLDAATRLKVIACQECSEFTKELTDDIRGKGSQIGILEEMADVLICIWTLQEIYGISIEDINRAVNVKLEEYDNKCKRNGGLV